MTHNSLILRIVILLAAFLTLSCQNNGRIGHWYGVWQVTGYTVDGADALTEQGRNTTFTFQNNIVQVKWPEDAYQGSLLTTGTWQEQDGDKVTFNFMHHDDNYGPGQGVYSAPAWLGMVSTELMHMTFTTRGGRDMTWTWTDPQGRRMVYNLHKQR